MTATTHTPRIYCGTYHKYNSGSLQGAWVDLDNFTSLEELYQHLKDLHKDEEDPEYMFQDYEHIPECFISESWLSEQFYTYLALEAYDKERFNLVINAYGEHYLEPSELLERLEDVQTIECGDPAQEYMCEIYPELDKISDSMHFVSIDWERTEKDFFMDWAIGTDGENNDHYVYLD